MTAEQSEAIGLVVDNLENALYATRLKLPAETHVECLKTTLRESRDTLAKVVREATGEDPWANNPLDG